MSYHLPLEGSETLRFEGDSLTLSRTYFRKGFRNEPIRVWANEETEVQHRPDTMELIAVNLETGEQTFVEIDGQDGDALVLEATRN